MNRKDNKITKLELIEIISDKTGITRKKVNKVLEALREVIKQSTIEDKKILIEDFLKIESYDTKEREINFPNLKKALKIKPKRKIRIRLVDSFIEEINEELSKKGNKE